jgi:hypothetical protein
MIRKSKILGIVLLLLFCACNNEPIQNNSILFIEQHKITNGVLLSGPEPPLIMVDFPTYIFNKENNTLEGLIDFEITAELKLIYGSGGCLTGTAGGGCSTGLIAGYSFPFSHGAFELPSNNSLQKITCFYKGEKIELLPGEMWSKIEVRIDTIEVDGELSINEITTTDNLIFHGILENSDVIPWEW